MPQEPYGYVFDAANPDWEYYIRLNPQVCVCLQHQESVDQWMTFAALAGSPPTVQPEFRLLSPAVAAKILNEALDAGHEITGINKVTAAQLTLLDPKAALKKTQEQQKVKS